MWQMRKVISNTSCLIVLSNIGKLELLREVYESVLITEEVALEFGEPVPAWINVQAVKDCTKTKLIANMLDLGESSTLALAIEQDDALVILDDGKARRFAKGLDISFTGTLGVVIKAKQIGIDVDLEKIIDDFRRVGFRIPKDIESMMLDENSK